MKTDLQKFASTLRRWFGCGTPGVACLPVSRPAALSDPIPLDKVLLQARDDHAKVNRLMAFEVRRSPELARAEAIRQGNECWERDLMV